MNAPIKPQYCLTVYTRMLSLLCDDCAELRPRANSLEARVRGIDRFLCDQCCERFGASSYFSVFGDPGWSLLNLIVEEGGSRA